MNKEQVLLVGGGGNLEALLDVLDDLDFEPAGVLDADRDIGNKIKGILVLGTDEQAKDLYDEGLRLAIIAIAEPLSLRRRLIDFYLALGFSIPALISPRAYISERAEICQGCIVFQNAVIGAGSHVGSHSLINVSAVLSHGIFLGECSHVAPQATLLGNVQVGDRTLVGAGAVVLPGLTIGSHAIVGAGSVVTKTVLDGKRWAGNPAREL